MKNEKKVRHRTPQPPPPPPEMPLGERMKEVEQLASDIRSASATARSAIFGEPEYLHGLSAAAPKDESINGRIK